MALQPLFIRGWKQLSAYNQERDCENNRYSNYKDWHRKKDWKDDSKIYIQKVIFFVFIRIFVSVNIA